MNAALTLLLAQLIDAREEAGLTQGDLGARVGATLSTIKAYEADYSIPRADRLIDMADVLGYDLILTPREGDAAPVTGRRHVIRHRTGKRREDA